MSSGDRAQVDVTELHAGFTVVSDSNVWLYMQRCCISQEASLGKHCIWLKNGRGCKCLTMIRGPTSVLLQRLKYKVVLKSLSRH